ncbi:ThiF family adenylyltransferase [Paenibacillus xylaniclasticus]|uniref:ThiF family adenylyltransferase n=1 Tax=Paenibacillus xylaniclasticus TaxID=588083 RepID=UPI000FD79EED|nr:MULTISPECIES: ThiF family adenylyltransferase [Paenibacillus]GFN30854.1 molybdopterin biosynthesis protein MoeB [Paenibacillus curdlanolyticus]
MTEQHQSESRPHSRYTRQMRYAPIGAAGQLKLSGSSAVIVGMGALGSVIAQHLVRGGIGKLRMIDRDIVEWSNLHRQLLYMEEDAEQMLPKAQAAYHRLKAANSLVELEPVVADLAPHNAEQLLTGFDLILDGTDNFTARYLINEISIKHNIPWIYGGAVGGSGVTASFIPGETPCFQCLFPVPPSAGAIDTCETAGVISPIIDIIASMQAADALKWLTGNRQAMNASLMQADVWHNQWFGIRTDQSSKPDCPVCQLRRFDHLEACHDETSAASLCGRNTVQITPAREMQAVLPEVARRLSAAGRIVLTRYLLRLELQDSNMTFVLFSDGRALIQGTDNLIVARKLYESLLGA